VNRLGNSVFHLPFKETDNSFTGSDDSRHIGKYNESTRLPHPFLFIIHNRQAAESYIMWLMNLLSFTDTVRY